MITGIRNKHQVIPADRNWELVEPVRGDDGLYSRLIFTPILAWSIQLSIDDEEEIRYTAVTPITYQDLPTHWALRRGNKTIIFPDDRAFPEDWDAVIAYFQELENRRNAFIARAAKK